jgi:putative tributyrin esterase
LKRAPLPCIDLKSNSGIESEHAYRPYAHEHRGDWRKEVSPMNPSPGKTLLPLIVALSLALLCACREGATVPADGGIITIRVPEDTASSAGAITGIPVDIFTPACGKSLKGDVLVLPGWNHARARWQNETRIMNLARERCFRLVFPEMGKTNYESEYFPETILKWAATPGGAWVRDMLIPALQKNGVLLKGGKNFLVGYSTGGRGVLMVSLQNPELFTAGASLSGDCDQTLLPDDPLYTEQYGPFTRFRDRWKKIDNPLTQISEWRMPLYLGHGKKDTVCPWSQTQIFCDEVRRRHPRLRIELHLVENAVHDFAYWDSELPAVFDFFEASR